MKLTYKICCFWLFQSFWVKPNISIIVTYLSKYFFFFSVLFCYKKKKMKIWICRCECYYFFFVSEIRFYCMHVSLNKIHRYSSSHTRTSYSIWFVVKWAQACVYAKRQCVMLTMQKENVRSFQKRKSVNSISFGWDSSHWRRPHDYY